MLRLQNESIPHDAFSTGLRVVLLQLQQPGSFNSRTLEDIFKESWCDAPQDLTVCFLRTQRYNLDVRCKKGPLMIIAGSRSRVHLEETLPSEEVKSLELIIPWWQIYNLRVSPSCLVRILKQESVHDPVSYRL